MIPSIAPSFSSHAQGLLRSMLLAREGDLRESLLVRQGRGSFNLSSAGHEGVAALAAHVRAVDMVFPAYRDRALMHALGMTVEEMARDFSARERSSSGGRNLPGHFSSRRLNVFSITSPVGAQCLPAVGAAWAFQKEGKGAVAFCHIGDAATRQGEFFEAVAQATAESLPVVFVVEDNGYGISTPTAGKTPLALGMLPSNIVVCADGREAGAVYDAGFEAADRARMGKGPTVLWLDLDRLGNHTNADDHRMYRSALEIETMAGGDPIERLAAACLASGWLCSQDLQELRRSAFEEVREAYARVEKEDAPSAAAVESHLFGPLPESYPALPSREEGTTMLRSTTEMLGKILASHPRAILFGEDIEDPKGGVFGITKGLSNDYPERVVNSPLAEATIVGMAVGLAVAGWLPIFELQFVDFVGPALNQLMAQVSNLRWRTRGEWTCPMVLYAPCGAYLPSGGMWHSQSNEGIFAAIPGLRVAVPSTAEDAAGLLWTAAHDEDPSLLLLPKHLLRADPDSTGSGDSIPVRWGIGRVVRVGSEATVVAWGNCVEIAVAAAMQLEDEGVSVEVVDPRTLVPCDWELIAESTAKTGRLIVVQEDSLTCGFGQAIVSEIVGRRERFETLRTAPILLSRPDVPVPFAPTLESAVLPSVLDVVRAVRSTLDTAAKEVTVGIGERAETDDEDVTTLTIPQLGEGLRQVRITALLKSPGDAVAMDEPLYEVETDKANVVVESSCAGTLVAWFAAVGEEAEVHGPIAQIAMEPSAIQASSSATVREEKPASYEEFPLSDRQRAMNRSALGGRLDVPLPASVGRPLSWKLVESARLRLRERYPRLRMTEFGVFACAAARATRAHPKFRSSLVSRGETVRRFAHVDLGFAVALPEDELATAVIHDADALAFDAFAEQIRARHREAKAGASQSDAGTTLLISSLAGHEVTDAAPVLFPPAIATLFVGAPHDAGNGPETTLRLAFDHRLINGVGAAEFLREIERQLESFGNEA